MQKVTILTLILVLSGLSFVGCKPNADQRDTSDSKAAVSNTDIEQQIMSSLKADDQLRNANLIVTADANKKEASVAGTVESDALRNRAIDLAKSAHSGFTVNDKIEIKPSEIARKDFTPDQAKQEWEKAKQAGDKVGNTIEDAWLHGKILAKLVVNAETSARNINVDVVEGSVTLRGNVSDAEEKSEAERIAKDTEGVKSVDNQLKVNT